MQLNTLRVQKLVSKLLSRSEAWEAVYQAYQNINFTAFDFPGVKQSLLEYMKLYYKEQFTDFIESSEIIAIIELFAYISELYAYRSDVNAHENFMPVAKRKDSVLRLAKNISYKASRNLPARGLVKITGIQTTQPVIDSRGRNLAGRKIIYNDLNNVDWKEQFLLVMNKVLQQKFGSVLPGDRKQVDDVLLEVYELSNIATSTGVFPYKVNYGGVSLDMELVPSTLTDAGPQERRPEAGLKMSMLYGNDGLGDGSPTTGFFFLTKQGSLQVTTTNFDGSTPNQTFILPVENINETDVWVNQVDPDTLATVDEDPNSNEVSGRWQMVDLAFAQNIIYNANPFRNKYEVETLDADKVRLIFGDGEFANIPSGMFQIWHRTSTGFDTAIPVASVIDKTQSITYLDTVGNIQTATFTFSLVNTLQNGSPSEDVEHIRRVAPAVYYTQDRMVNARDYNTFMLQDPSILKLKSINRTFAGDSKSSAWHDPSDTHSGVNLFGDDLALFLEATASTEVAFDVTNAAFLITQFVVPKLSTLEMFTLQTSFGVQPFAVRTSFTTNEYSTLEQAITQRINSNSNTPINLYLALNSDGSTTWSLSANTNFGQSTQAIFHIVPGANGQFSIETTTSRLIAQSETTRFWTINDPRGVVNFNTLTSTNDKIVVLKANDNNTRTATLQRPITYTVVKQALIPAGLPDAGLVDTRKVIVIGEQTSGLPSGIDLSSLVNSTITLYDQVNGNISKYLGQSYIRSDVVVTAPSGANVMLSYSSDPDETQIVDTVRVISYGSGNQVSVFCPDFVYLAKPAPNQQYQIAANTLENLQAYIDQLAVALPTNSRPWVRYSGRYPLNFCWSHSAPSYNAIDPCPTNIIDTFILTRSYYNAFKQYLLDTSISEPKSPTPFELRASYKALLDNRMISDTVILKPGNIKLLFGNRAPEPLRAKIKVIQSKGSAASSSQIKTSIVQTINTFFDITNWNFGDTFYFTELSTAIHNALPLDINSVTLVPGASGDQFGDLYEVSAREDEILQADISVQQIEIITALDSATLRQDG